MSKKNDFASIMSASLLLAGTSTLFINAIEEATLNNLKDLNKYRISDSVTFTKNPELENISFETNINTFSDESDNIKTSENKESVNNKNVKNNNENVKNDDTYKRKIFKDFSKEDRFILYRIVEAEAGTGDIKAKKNVANVIFNRLKSKKFPNTIREIVFAKNQFSPILDGRYWKVNIKDSTKEAVIKAYEEGDTTGGALYFANMKCVPNPKIRAWFNSMNCLFTDSINHSFYK